MLQKIKNKLSLLRGMKKITLAICTLLLTTFTVGSTYAYMITGTPSLVNLFINGVNPTGDLVILKSVSHPFGDTYTLPDQLRFSFDVNLGAEYAGKPVATTRGTVTADANGVITVRVAPGGRTTVFDIIKDTTVTVTETAVPAGFTPETASSEIVIQKSGENILTFNNIYSPQKAPADKLTVKGEKKLTGRDWMEGDSFTFRLDVTENGRWKTLGTQSVVYQLVEQPDPEKPDDPDATITLPKENFDKFDFTQIIQAYPFSTAGVYSFRVTEIEGTAGGVNYDKTESRFDILVGDADMDGYLEIQSVDTLSVNTTVENTDVYISFNNEYAPAGSAEVYINIEKTMEDTSGQSTLPSGFTFDLFDEQGTLIKTSAPTDSDGKTYIRMVYEPSQAGGEYIYTIKETNAGQTVDFITYDSTEYKVKVSVVDNLDGTVSAYICDLPLPEDPNQDETVPDIPQNEDAAAGDNTENTGSETDSSDVSAAPENTPVTDETPTQSDKTADSNTAVDNTASAESADSSEIIDEENNDVETGADEDNQDIFSDSVPESPSDDENIPTEDIAISDRDNKSDIIIVAENDEAVQDNHPENTGDENTDDLPPEELTNIYQATFINKYDPQDASVVLTGKKTLSGRDLKDKEFDFYLCQTDKNFKLPDGTSPTETVSNAMDGTISFSPLVFDKVGSYYYIVFEDVNGNLGGVTYDYTCYFVTITVKDNNGVLEHSVYITDSYGAEKSMEFVNTYKAAPAFLSLPGKKILNGADLLGDDFFFQLYAADESFNALGNVLKTVTNDSTGWFEFKDIPFESAGTYRFIIKEDCSKAKEGMTYDNSVYCITVDVYDPGNGTLAIRDFILTESGLQTTGIVFENTYTAPEIPDEPVIPDEPETPGDPSTPPVPDTGDNTNVIVYAGAFAGAVAALIIVLIIRKKRNKQNNQK